MNGRKFFGLLGTLFLIVLIIYMVTTPKGNAYPLIGVVDGNEVIVSPQTAGRIVKLTVDEGSQVKKGDLIAALEAQVQAQEGAIQSLQAQVKQGKANQGMVDSQTTAAIRAAQANVTSSEAELEQAKATLQLNAANMKRSLALFASGIVSVQDRDAAVAAY